MARSLPWVSLVVVALGIACAGVGASAVWAGALSLDGSRAWWTAEARAVAFWLVGSAAAVAVAVAAFGVGAAALWYRAAEPGPGAEPASP